MKCFFLILLFPSFLLWSQPNFEKAEKCFLDKNYSKAKSLFENVLKENPNHLKTLEYLGDIECHYNSWENAVLYYKKIKMLKPTEANYYYKYGGALGMEAKESNVFKALGMIDEVEKSFIKAIQINPKHIEARWALIELYLQLPAVIGGSEAKANRYATELAELSPIDGYLAKGHIAEYFKRFQEAEKQYKKAIAVGNSKTSFLTLANLYRNKMNRPEESKKILEEMEKRNLNIDD